MRKLTALFALCLLAGCGGEDKTSETESRTTDAAATADVVAQDARAKAGARILSTYVEACFADKQDYSGCTTGDALGATEVDLGSEAGQVEVLDAGAAGYRIVAHSESGNTYTITKSDTGMQRSCEAATETRSFTGGSW